MSPSVYRRGLGLKLAVAGEVAGDYGSRLVDEIKASGFRYTAGRLTVRLAREMGFCYGVDRAVDYAYQTRRRFPDRPLYLTSEIIHNPSVNANLRAAGIRFLSDATEDATRLGPEAVVILPAFGVAAPTLERIVGQGCTVIDTTCGSVLLVWNRVRKYADEGFTAVIHGKVHHEETCATTSQMSTAGGRYLVVLDRAEAAIVCDFIRHGGDSEAFLSRFAEAASPGFVPGRDLRRVGLANQTTMLRSESLEIGELFRRAMVDRHGVAALDEHYQAFETICTATQDRQDAARTLVAEQALDLAFVVGGYNSSNTRHLARICAESVSTYHVADADCLTSSRVLRHLPVSSPCADGAPVQETFCDGWLPAGGPVSVGVTAGASTPNRVVGNVVARLIELAARP